jgi:hypothetical protein
MTSRPTPYDLVFGEIGDARFPPLERAIATAGHDPRSRDGFTLVREVVTLLQELRPEEPLGEGVGELVALVHAAFLFWLDGRSVVGIDRETLDRIMRRVPERSGMVGPAARSYYLQLPPQRVWGEPLADAPPEPLDGAFVVPGPDLLDVIAVFGLHPARPGLTVVEARGARPGRLVRLDRTAPFAPRVEGGAAAGLVSLVGAEELLELVYRCHALLGPNGAEPGLQLVSVA